MSYSRWGSSCWYTFWCVSDSELRDDQIFEICSVKSFTFKELTTDGVDACIERVKHQIIEENKMSEKDKKLFSGGKYSKDEYEELKIYMNRFIRDVQMDYKKYKRRR